MPWTDHSKPASKPGPWDTPDGGHADEAPPTPKSDPPRAREVGAERTKPSRPSNPLRVDGSRTPKRTPPPRGPDLDELGQALRRWLGRFALNPSGRGLRTPLLAGVLGAVLGGWLLSGLHGVEPDEIGVVTRFGAVEDVLPPGLHYRLPAPIERVDAVARGVTRRLVLGGAGGGAPDGLQMLTRDGALVSLGLVVQWRINDPRRFFADTATPEATLRMASESAGREAVGRRTLADLIADRAGVSDDAAARLQRLLDQYGLGVRVVGVEIADIAAPAAAQGGLRDLTAALDDAGAAAREAGVYRARVLADARGEAAVGVHQAEAVRDREVAEAKGEAARFAMVDKVYRQAPEVTRDRLYSETMARVLHDANKIIVQPSKGGALPLSLPPDLLRPKGAEPAANPPSGAAPQPVPSGAS